MQIEQFSTKTKDSAITGYLTIVDVPQAEVYILTLIHLVNYAQLVVEINDEANEQLVAMMIEKGISEAHAKEIMRDLEQHMIYVEHSTKVD